MAAADLRGGGYYLINNARNTLNNPIPGSRSSSSSSSSPFNKADRDREAKFLKVPPTPAAVLWDNNEYRRRRRTTTGTAAASSLTTSISSNEFDSPDSRRRRLHRNQIRDPPPPRQRQRRRRSLIKISPKGNCMDDKWKCDYILSLKQLDLQDLAAEEEEEEEVVDDQVSISLSIQQQHASFGLSVDGRIVTSFTRTCIICSSPYCSKLDTKFNIWVLPSRRQRRRATPMPEIGGDDPSAIYVKPGEEADLDSHVRDTIRLASSFQETCSKSCDQAEPIVHYVGEAPSIDSRWSKLLELKNSSSS